MTARQPLRPVPSSETSAPADPLATLDERTRPDTGAQGPATATGPVDGRRWARRVVVVLLCLSPAVRYLSGDLEWANIANADHLSVPAAVDSVQRHGFGVLTTWGWPPSPYFATDYVLYTPLWLVLPDAWLAPAVFMVVQLLLLARVAGRLAVTHGAGGASPATARWAAVSCFGLIVVLAGATIDPARMVLVSYYRGASVIVAGLVVIWLLRVASAGSLPGRWGVATAPVAGVAAAALVVSDPLSLPAIVGPTAALLAVLGVVARVRGRPGPSLPAVVAVVVAAGLGVVAGLVANDGLRNQETAYGPSITGAQPRVQLDLLVSILEHVSRWLVAASAAAVAVLAVAAVVEWRRSGDGPAVPPSALLLGFSALTWVGHVAGIMVDSTPPAARYLVVPFLAPILFAGPAGVVVGRELLRPWLAGSAPGAAGRAGVLLRPPVVACLVAAPAVALAVPQLGRVELHTKPPEAACLDEAVPDSEPLTGVAGYWDARMIQLHSDHPRDVAVLDGTGTPWFINGDTALFDGSWDFAVIRREAGLFDPPIDLIRHYAPDAIETTCGSFAVFRFDPPIPARPLAAPGDAISWSGCELSTAVGRIDGSACAIVVEPSDPAGFSSHGGYTPLPPGRYRIHLTYTSDDGTDEEVGVVEITRTRSLDRPFEVVEHAPLTGTGGSTVDLEIGLTVPDDGHPFMAEVRTQNKAGVHLELRSVELELVDG